jgi:hypothetical protein
MADTVTAIIVIAQIDGTPAMLAVVASQSRIDQTPTS